MSCINISSKTEKRNKRFTATFACRVLALVLSAIVMMGVFTACGNKNDDYVENELDQSYDKDQDSLDVEKLVDTILPLTEDAGTVYIDETLFIGDSNTVRSQLYGHTTWDNVVAAVSMGVQHITSLKMTYFKGYDEPVTVPKAVEIIQPKRIIITYGTNNTIGYAVEDFLKMYKEGLEAVKTAYPYADIIINSIPPVDKERENTAITMQTIDAMNKALSEMAKEEGYKFLNSAEVLKDEETGFAKKDYTIGDGVHLSKLGMDAMFEYFRTHAYITEDTRPKPLKKVPEREETPTGVISQDPIAVRGSRIKIVFKSSDLDLGKVEGEVEQKIKRTITSQAVKAVPLSENGGVFVGWSCDVDGLSSKTDKSVTFTVPKVDENVTEIVITANFVKVELALKDKATDKTVKSITLEKGEEKQLLPMMTEGYDGKKDVKWKIEDETIATVDENGKLTAVKGGQTKLTVSILDGKIAKEYDVTVKPPLEGLAISGDSTMLTGQSIQLTASGQPAGATFDSKKVEWSSSDEAIATVSGGKVMSLNAGTVKITAKYGDFTASHTINVVQPKPLQSITLSGNTEIFEDETTQLQVEYSPADTTDSKTAAWSTSDKAVATVADGVVTAKKPGTVEITCTVGQHTAKITVTIKQRPNYVKSVSLSSGSISVKAGESATVKATYTLAFPDRADEAGLDTSATWSAANGYVSVADGVITVKDGLTSDTGSLTDTVTVKIGGQSASCTVTINNLPMPPCAKCGETGHKAEAHCVYCGTVNCTVTHCTKCGGADHVNTDHCQWCGEVKCAKTHCPTCGSTEHAQHPIVNDDVEVSLQDLGGYGDGDNPDWE